MNDQQFLAAFKTHRLQHFPHRDHIRLAWILLREDGLEQGIAHIRLRIQQFANHHGHSTLYHETITLFWAKAVFHAMQQTPETECFDDFADANLHLFDKDYIQQFYTKAFLQSAEARATWVEPDIKALSTK